LIFRLVILNGPRKGERITVPIEPLTIGRDPECGLFLDDPEVAARHAVVEHFQGGLLVRDLGTMNRILVNKREAPRAVLKHGDVIEIGRTSLLVQAFVQAEVKGRPPEVIDGSPSRSPARLVGIGLALLLAAAGVLRLQSRSDLTPAAPETNAPPLVGIAEPAPTASVSAPPPTVVVVTAAVPSGATEAEIQRLREELAVIKDAFRTLATQSVWPPSVAVATAAPAPPSAIQSLPSRAELSARALAAARREVAAGRLEAADAMLARLQEQDPDYLPAYETRALLMERRGLFEGALGQWAVLYQRAAGRPEAERAADEWARISDERRRAATTVPRRVEIRSLEQQRFPDAPDYDEMRLVRVLAASASAVCPAAGSIRLEVLFFDEAPAGAVALTRAMPARVEAVPTAGWGPDHTLSLNAAYVVPLGFRRRTPGRFHGFIARLYCEGRLEDEAAKPVELLIRGDGGRGATAIR